MSRFAALLCCAFALLATTASAQSTTEDGIRAMVRGEYQAAGRILRPLANEATPPDPVAQFFLAILYQTGQGVTGDMVRACSMFLSAARQPHPFTEQSAAIAAVLRDQLGGPNSPCIAEERWQGGPPQAFVLGPNHRIVFADTSISLTYGDREWRTLLSLGLDASYLPIQYTTLDVTRPTAVRRHFFQWFAWTPSTTANPSWTLSWMLIEVAGEQWIPITSEKSLVIVAGATKPASYDVSKLVRLRVTERGEAEFTVLAGTVSRTEVIAWPGSR